MTSFRDTNIPTISAAVSTSSLSTMSSPNNSNAALNSNKEKTQHLTTKQMIQLKLKENENVLSIFEAYQIVGQQHISRLLSLVVSISGGTYAVFSMTPTRSPARYPSDITIDKVFPLDDTFQISCDKKGSISQLLFSLQNADETPSKYFYYPIITDEDASDFETFQAQVISAKMSMIHSTTETNGLSFAWINNYREIGEVKQEMKRRENEYIKYKPFTIYCATYNVNNKTYCDSPLNSWLAAYPQPPDIYAIALQELDTSAKAITFSENRPDALWINKMLESVHNKGEYEELTSVRLVGMMLTIIIKRHMRSSIVHYNVKTIARGILNTLGNKGGVAVSLQLDQSHLCFVNSHLAAHMGFVEARNEDYAGIVKGLVFDDELRRTINDHDYIFWIGDLNYRIEEPPGLQLPMSRSDPNAAEILLKYDQLRQEMRKGNCFEGYNEGRIKFPPTYKYDPGTDNFDSSEKQRAPAYCDRILWKGARIKQLAYDSVMDIRLSDHKPVYAVFSVSIKTRDDYRYMKIHDEVLKLLDKRENERQPQIKIEKTIIDFGMVRFNEPAFSDFTVSNVCPLMVDLEFKRKDPPIDDICEKWLKVEPIAEYLWIDCTKRIRVTLTINADSITSLLNKIRTAGNYKFDFDILILQVIRGPHIFITVTGEYKPSCFGLSMETLCRTNRPLCEYNQQQIKELMNDNSPEFRVTMPREFFLLIDYLHKQGANVEGAFSLSTLEFKCAKDVKFNCIRDWLDTWSSSDFPGTPHAAAEALLMLLNLPEKPLLDPYVEILVKTNTMAEAMELIAQLSSPKRNVFMHLCMFLREGIERKYYNLKEVATIFGHVLLRSTNTKSNAYYRNISCCEFMQRFLATDSEVRTLSSSTPSPSPSSSSTPSGPVNDSHVKITATATAAAPTHSNTPTASKGNVVEMT